MPSETSCNYWVFRDGRFSAPGETALRELVSSLADLRHASPDRILDALIRSGEIETALADIGSADAHLVAGISNAVAALLVRLFSPDASFDCLSEIAAQLKIPDQVQLSTVEGFAYYALHPLAFADMVDCVELRSSAAAVIGIRSIGATLSAVVTATLARRNIHAERITVRPDGHPYDRHTRFSDSQLRWIAAQRSHDADFFIVDEGPGLSGSSFLSVGEALLQAGVERRRIHFLCSRQVDPTSLVAPNAPQRWCSFDSAWPDVPRHLPARAERHIGGGEWRRWKYERESDWPAAWTYMERAKYISKDDRRLYKFIGLGKFGAVVEDRARILASAKFSPRVFSTDQGYAEYDVVPGRPALLADLSQSILDRIARYCAMRSSEFRAGSPDTPRLDQMTRFNYGNEFGTEPECLDLDSPHPVIADGRMLPHEWVFDASGNLIKTDGDIHGDDHFFPGPVDIAWDVAGAIVEWDMDPRDRDYFLSTYVHLTGDPIQRRIASYVFAYSVFRIGMSRMGAHSLRGTPEEVRLLSAAAYYRAFIQPRTSAATANSESPLLADNPASAA